MIQFSKLRIHGFKSFVDRTEMDIAPGLSGIVGPNGCGKSNLVEALKWVMGESSAKRMRGGGMEDVIFSGTEKRAKRNVAEVSLLLDNNSRVAPAAFNNADEIEVTRKIERDHGSLYKINGRTVRARDVQMLFADTVTGANSPSMVSQGHVTKMINAKPHERRLILEESAGISGLYARRHEAELRLKGADTNLLRVEDVLTNMESRLGSLKRQAKQAARYRNINAQIRQIEVLIAWLEWSALAERTQSTTAVFENAESIVADKLGVVTQLTKTQTTQSQDLPDLRKKEAEMAAGLQACKLELQRLEDEAARHAQNLQDLQNQLEQTTTDLAHEQSVAQEAETMLGRLEEEQKTLLEKQDDDSGQKEEKEKLRLELEQKVVELEEKYTAVMQSAAESKARQESLEQQIEQNTARMETIGERKTQAETALNNLNIDEEKNETIKALSKDIEEIETKLESTSDEDQSHQDKIAAIKQDVEQSRDQLQMARGSAERFTAEINMLENMFKNDEEKAFTPILDQIQTQSGFEKALSRALGDTLMASLDENAPSRWLKSWAIPTLPELPKGVETLKPYIDAPKELHAALSQIGYVPGDDVAVATLKSLKPGQSIVSQNGSYWRWDGFHVEATATDRHAQQLEQKNKWQELKARQPEIEKEVTKAQDNLQNNIDALEKAELAFQTHQHSLQALTLALTNKSQELSTLREEQSRLNSEKSRLEETIRMANEDLQTLQEVIHWDKERLKACSDETQDQQEQDTEELRESLSQAREAHQEAVRAFDSYMQEQRSRQARLQAMADERVAVQNRLIRARERVKSLQDRQERFQTKLANVKENPADSEELKATLLQKFSEHEKRRDEAAEALAICEGAIAETNKALKEAEILLSEAREKRAGAQATLAIIKEQQETMIETIQQKFEMAPHELKNHAALDLEQSESGLEHFKTQKEQLVRERESIGAVNLRAETEAQELETEVTTLLHERNDLIQAIDELRQGIATINKEARERLNIAFEHVNAHFQSLFKRLFAGGEAHLALIDSDDPLDAGLEIFAQPPGKALQALSLLSGGEQTLASIALIFAMFLTNPSPICVLDEIDAPLDDSNVDRVCDLLEEIAERGETRFLIITHHRLTMARMDRLYGVTMSEKGVSQLVSVDLQQSFDFLDEAA